MEVDTDDKKSFNQPIGLEALPDEVYPRVIDKRQPDGGYYIALGLVLSVWMITPLCW
jgi:hypothetical protein